MIPLGFATTTAMVLRGFDLSGINKPPTTPAAKANDGLKLASA